MGVFGEVADFEDGEQVREDFWDFFSARVRGFDVSLAVDGQAALLEGGVEFWEGYV